MKMAKSAARAWLPGALTIVMLAACGGGGGGSEAAPAAPVNPVTPAAPASAPSSAPAANPSTPASSSTATDCSKASGSDFLGINGHSTRASGPYKVDNATLIKRLKDLGVRHYRTDGAESADGLVKLAALADEAKASCIKILPILIPAIPFGVSDSQAYSDGFNYGQNAARALKGKVDEIELGNEYDLQVRKNDTVTGELPSDFDKTRFETMRNFLIGMQDGVKHTAPEMKTMVDNGLPMDYAQFKMLWDGIDANGQNGKAKFHPDKFALHWYAVNGNIDAFKSKETPAPFTSLPQYLHDTYGVEVEITETGGFNGQYRLRDGSLNPAGTDQAKADYIRQMVPQFYADRARSGLTQVYYYQLYNLSDGGANSFDFSLLDSEDVAVKANGGSIGASYDALKQMATSYP